MTAGKVHVRRRTQPVYISFYVLSGNLIQSSEKSFKSILSCLMPFEATLCSRRVQSWCTVVDQSNADTGTLNRRNFAYDKANCLRFSLKSLQHQSDCFFPAEMASRFDDDKESDEKSLEYLSYFVFPPLPPNQKQTQTFLTFQINL